MHFQQSDFWKEFKQSVGNETLDLSFGWLQITKLPLGLKVGYLPPIKSEEIKWDELYSVAKLNNIAYITVDFEDRDAGYKVQGTGDSNQNNKLSSIIHHQISKSIRLNSNCINDLSINEVDLLKKISKGDRYLIRQGEKHAMEFVFDDSEKSFKDFRFLFNETKKRQKYLGRNEDYLQKIWNLYSSKYKSDVNLKINIATCYYKNEPQASMMLFGFGETVYYPYGGSILTNSKLGPTYFLAWNVLQKSKELGYKNFDWMGLEQDTKTGFSAFKTKFGGDVVKYVSSIDVIINKPVYLILSNLRKLREKLAFLKRIYL